MRFAYREVGEGREQDAEASYLSASYGLVRFDEDKYFCHEIHGRTRKK
jgi:hypothetical protein